MTVPVVLKYCPDYPLKYGETLFLFSSEKEDFFDEDDGNSYIPEALNGVMDK